MKIEQVPVTIRIPQEQLALVDLYAKEQDINRSDLLRSFILNMITDLEKNKFKDKLIAASKKVSQHSLNENLDFDASNNDGLTNEY